MNIMLEIFYNLYLALIKESTLIGMLIYYFIGSIPFGVMEGHRLRGPDWNILDYGSGSMGAANVERLLGKKAGSKIKKRDILKGLLPTAISYLLVQYNLLDRWQLVAMALALGIGHCFSVFNMLVIRDGQWKIGKLMSGKGASTTYGILLVTNPLSGIAGYLARWAIVKWKKKSAPGTIVGIIVAFTCSIMLFLNSWLSLEFLTLLGLLTLLVLLMHISNIVRLVLGKENTLSHPNKS